MTKHELMTAIETGWREYRDQVESYDRKVVELEAHDGWSVKDHVAHIAAWERNLIALFAGQSRYGAMGVKDFPPGTDFDEINAAVRLLHHDRSYEEVDAFSRETHAEVVTMLEDHSEEDLSKPYVHFQPQAAGKGHAGEPVQAWVSGMTHEHYGEHRPWIASLVEEVSTANRS